MLSRYPFTHLLFWTGGFTCASKNGVANKSTSSYTPWIYRFNERRSAFKIEKMKEKSFKCILKAAIVVVTKKIYKLNLLRCSVAMSYFFSLRTAGKLPCLKDLPSICCLRSLLLLYFCPLCGSSNQYPQSMWQHSLKSNFQHFLSNKLIQACMFMCLCVGTG